MEPYQVEPERTMAAPDLSIDGRNGPRGVVRRWAGRGFRWTSYIAAPAAFVVALLGLSQTAVGFGSGRGLALAMLAPKALVIYPGLPLLGASIGAITGLAAGAIGPRRRTPRGAAGAPPNPPSGRFRARRTEDRASSKPRTSPLVWVIAAGATITVITLSAALGAGVYAGRSVDRRLAEEIAEAERDTPLWRIEDQIARRAPVPDAENAAIVVREALALLPEGWPLESGTSPDLGDQPPSGVAAALDLLDASEANVALDDGAAEALRGDLERFGEAVRIARTLAEYDRGRHELVLGPNVIDTLLTGAQAVRDLGRLLSADAAIRVGDGDPDGAIDSCRAILGAARSIGDEPFAISQLVRVAVGTDAAESAQRVLGQSEPSDAALGRLQALLLDERSRPLFLHALRGERGTMVELIRRIGTGELSVEELDGGPAAEPDRAPDAAPPWTRLLFDNQRAVALEIMNDAVAAARRPNPDRLGLLGAWEWGLHERSDRPFASYTEALPLVMVPALGMSGLAHARYEAQLGATAMLLAAERHRIAHGEWPETIDAIDPSILDETPADPFSGDPYLMERAEGRLLIHSIGPNARDDHGAFDPKRWSIDGPDDVGAIGWDVPRRRRPPPPADDPPA